VGIDCLPDGVSGKDGPLVVILAHLPVGRQECCPGLLAQVCKYLDLCLLFGLAKAIGRIDEGLAEIE
jgi:hypothetical protein